MTAIIKIAGVMAAADGKFHENEGKMIFSQCLVYPDNHKFQPNFWWMAVKKVWRWRPTKRMVKEARES